MQVHMQNQCDRGKQHQPLVRLILRTEVIRRFQTLVSVGSLHYIVMFQLIVIQHK
jgi:hypothetical protein